MQQRELIHWIWITTWKTLWLYSKFHYWIYIYNTCLWLYRIKLYRKCYGEHNVGIVLIVDNFLFRDKILLCNVEHHIIMKFDVWWVSFFSLCKHTYLAREIPWSTRGFSQGEACPLHSGRADPCDRLKCRWLECVIFWWGGLRSRYPLHKTRVSHIYYYCGKTKEIRSAVSAHL